jgi:ankyrin repeat protein
LAARRGANHAQAAEVLLASGCRVDSQDAHGCTPIHFAAGAGAVAMLGRFLELAPGAADAPDSISWTPLFWACNNGHAAAAERLLGEGASPWRRDCNQRLPLHFAAEAGHTACVRLLVQHMRCSRDPDAPAGSPASLDVPDQNGQTPVQLASEHGHPECAALLLDADGTGEAKRRTALHLAAAQGQLQIAKQVLATRRLAVSAKDADGWLPIHCAAAAGHADIVAALLGAGSDCDDAAADGDTPLHKAAIAGHLPVVQLLKGRSGLDARNSAGSTPLYNAASQGHLGVIRELLQEGAAMDAATTNGCSPLYIAANNGCTQAAALLLEAGADPDLETTSGCTPLHAGRSGPVRVWWLLKQPATCRLHLQSAAPPSP